MPGMALTRQRILPVPVLNFQVKLYEAQEILNLFTVFGMAVQRMGICLWYKLRSQSVAATSAQLLINYCKLTDL